jgi:hypothetical protein
MKTPSLAADPRQTMDPDTRIIELSLELPPPFGIVASGDCSPLVIDGNFGYLASHGPLLPNGKMMTGRVGSDLDAATAFSAAKQTGLSLLATLKNQLGHVARVRQLVKSLVMINCTPDFIQHPQVADGFSTLFVDVFGEDRGRGVRSAIGVHSLPGDVPIVTEIVIAM